MCLLVGTGAVGGICAGSVVWPACCSSWCQGGVGGCVVLVCGGIGCGGAGAGTGAVGGVWAGSVGTGAGGVGVRSSSWHWVMLGCPCHTRRQWTLCWRCLRWHWWCWRWPVRSSVGVGCSSYLLAVALVLVHAGPFFLLTCWCVSYLSVFTLVLALACSFFWLALGDVGVFIILASGGAGGGIGIGLDIWTQRGPW